MSADLRFAAASPSDAMGLADIRVSAMRPSLETIGRFDPERARARFLSTYVTSDTILLMIGEETAGFYVLRNRGDHLVLDHLYVLHRFQGRRIGTIVVDRVQARARALSVPIRLMALAESPANAFYRDRGFDLERAHGVDNHLIWRP